LEQAQDIEASGMTPLDYMIAVMDDSDVDSQMRLEAAEGLLLRFTPDWAALSYSDTQIRP